MAIGEIGLDYREGMEDKVKKTQQEFFDAEIKIAKKMGLPFVVHCRDAWGDTLRIIKENMPYSKPFLIHCFTGGIDNYNNVVSMGGYVAFGGIVTYNKTEKLQEVVDVATNYVIETDLPWLAPIPNRGKLNMPEYINDTIQYIATKKNITPQEVVNISKLNSINIFGTSLMNHIDQVLI